MNILKKNYLPLSSMIAIIANVLANDGIFVAKSDEAEEENTFTTTIKGHRKLSSTDTDRHVPCGDMSLDEYCKFLQSIGKSCQK